MQLKCFPCNTGRHLSITLRGERLTSGPQKDLNACLVAIRFDRHSHSRHLGRLDIFACFDWRSTQRDSANADDRTQAEGGDDGERPRWAAGGGGVEESPGPPLWAGPWQERRGAGGLSSARRRQCRGNAAASGNRAGASGPGGCALVDYAHLRPGPLQRSGSRR